MLDRLHDTPAHVSSDCGEMIAQNAMSRALSGDALARPPRERNLLRRFFLDPAAREMFPPEDVPEHARLHVANLRAVAAARPDDPEPAALVAELRSSSEEFARLWEDHEVAVRRQSTKRFRHPLVGLLELDCEILLNQDAHHLLIIHTARPGTESHERLQLLRVIGLQDMSPRRHPDHDGERRRADRRRVSGSTPSGFRPCSPRPPRINGTVSSDGPSDAGSCGVPHRVRGCV